MSQSTDAGSIHVSRERLSREEGNSSLLNDSFYSNLCHETLFDKVSKACGREEVSGAISSSVKHLFPTGTVEFSLENHPLDSARARWVNDVMSYNRPREDFIFMGDGMPKSTAVFIDNLGPYIDKRFGSNLDAAVDCLEELSDKAKFFVPELRTRQNDQQLVSTYLAHQRRYVDKKYTPPLEAMDAHDYLEKNFSYLSAVENHSCHKNVFAAISVVTAGDTSFAHLLRFAVAMELKRNKDLFIRYLTGDHHNGSWRERPFSKKRRTKEEAEKEWKVAVADTLDPTGPFGKPNYLVIMAIAHTIATPIHLLSLCNSQEEPSRDTFWPGRVYGQIDVVGTRGIVLFEVANCTTKKSDCQSFCCKSKRPRQQEKSVYYFNVIYDGDFTSDARALYNILDKDKEYDSIDPPYSFILLKLDEEWRKRTAHLTLKELSKEERLRLAPKPAESDDRSEVQNTSQSLTEQRLSNVTRYNDEVFAADNNCLYLSDTDYEDDQGEDAANGEEVARVVHTERDFMRDNNEQRDDQGEGAANGEEVARVVHTEREDSSRVDQEDNDDDRHSEGLSYANGTVQREHESHEYQDNDPPFRYGDFNK